MVPVIYSLVFGVALGLLATDATTYWLKVLGWVLSSWMFLAAIIAGVQMTRDDD